MPGHSPRLSLASIGPGGIGGSEVFETCWKPENLRPETKETAGAAWREMSILEQ